MGKKMETTTPAEVQVDPQRGAGFGVQGLGFGV